MNGASDDPVPGQVTASRDAETALATPLTAVQRVYAHVREGVLAGEFEEGAMLSENQIAAELGVSRTPVREAFVQLQGQGYLRLYPRRGALVVPVSLSEITAVLETRWAVERHAIERLATTEQAGGLAAMREAIDRQAALLAADEMVAFSATDREFHRAAVVATGNLILLELYDSLRDRQRRMVQGTVASDPTIADDILVEHRAILDATAAGDASTATRLLQAHLERARQTLVD
ncbi:MAG: GntR family transcriptional regulator [Solirubrobacteraceae bacterium]|nr:GntR family transcriptional regulator [Solirubrobacteraceae bacterium]